MWHSEPQPSIFRQGPLAWLGNDISQADLDMWTQHRAAEGRPSPQPLLSFHCFPQMSSASSITLPSQVPSVWETLLSFLHPASAPWLAPSKTEGLCADVPGERPAPLPWENMWSGSVYAGALSTCLPHSKLASDSARWQCSTVLPLEGLSEVGVTPAIMLTHLESWWCESTHSLDINSI